MASAIARAFCQPIKNQIGVAQPARCLGAVSHATANSKVAETKEKNWKIIQNVDNSPLSRVIIAVKAGSRYETSSNLGITHLIRHAIQAGSEGGNDLGIYNSLEIVGSVLNVNTGRDLAFVSFNASNQYGLEIIEPLMRVVFRNGVSEIDWERYGKFSSKVGYDLAVLNTQPTVSK
ncbi:hypothetical protein DPMN_026817 [Dreissena polymorpha]|uniref:Peptidase M16 N-terminal domain-containing protein n=1 Tax=Dreissena polymorpha TaxID=45954 RepID=A0A9D4LU38_DREPO|nr:hypothetical protein DPMN_026817 [Dreissena polymorpha]